MNLAFDTRIFILICCLLQGLAGLRMIKVSIPAYKLRGESAFLECQYELNKSRGTIGGTQTRSRHNYNHHYQRTSGTSNMNYVDNNDSQGDDEVPAYTRMRTQQQQQQPYRRQPYFQPLVQPYQGQWQGGSSGSSSSSSSIGSASGSITTHTGTYYQQQYPYQTQQQQQQQSYYTQKYEQPEYQQYTPPPSPYGHSIYRGRTQTSSSSSSSSSLSSSSIYNSKYGGVGGGHVGASTHTGKTYISSSGTIGGTSSFARHPLRNDDSNADSHERDHADDVDDNTNEDEDDEDVFDRNHDEEEDEEEGEDLYAIKWYKDNEEFYRYVPKANPPKTSYRVDGVRVIEEHSDSTRVLLRGLTINSTGLYRCEVSAEAPNFSSVQGEGRMDIVYLPRDGPHIKGQQFQYQIGETLNLNCTSGKSHPASHLQWFINDQPVVDGHYLVRYNDTVHRHGLITSTLGLEMTVDARHFNNGAMRVKCLASISPVLWKGGKESVLQRRPGIIDNREAMLLVRSSSTSLHHHRHCNNIFNILAQLRVLTVTTILMKLCQLLLLHTEYT